MPDLKHQPRYWGEGMLVAKVTICASFRGAVSNPEYGNHMIRSQMTSANEGETKGIRFASYGLAMDTARSESLKHDAGKEVDIITLRKSYLILGV